MFRIGEFSKIAQVSGRLLRYYDELGLLSPDYTDRETGYRYYSAKQLPQLNRILVLKELGLSLEQIAQVLESDTSTAEIRGMLALRKAQIELSVQEEMMRLRMVESRLQQIDTHGQIQEPDVVLKSIPAQQFLALREVLPGMPGIRRVVQKMVGVVPAVVGQSNLGYVTVVLHAPSFDPEEMDVEVGYVLTGKTQPSIRLSEERTLTVRQLPAVTTMATLVHMGAVTETHRSYGPMANWLERNNWQITGTVREVLMQLPTEGKEESAVVELQLPVSQIGEKLGA